MECQPVEHAWRGVPSALESLGRVCTPGRPVVILAEGNKEDMDKQLKRALNGSSLEWHTRQVGPMGAQSNVG